MALQTQYENLPPDVIRHARHALLDAMAVTIGGLGMGGISGVGEMGEEKGGKPGNKLAFYGGKGAAPGGGAGLRARRGGLDGSYPTAKSGDSGFAVSRLCRYCATGPGAECALEDMTPVNSAA